MNLIGHFFSDWFTGIVVRYLCMRTGNFRKVANLLTPDLPLKRVELGRSE